MAMIKKLAVIAAAAEAARRYAKKNPDKASKYLDQAAQFVDKQTKGKYSGQIDGVTQKAKGVAGIHTPGSHRHLRVHLCLPRTASTPTASRR